MTTPREYALTPPAHLVPGLLDGSVTQVRVPVKCPKWLREMCPDFTEAFPDRLWGVTPGLHVPLAITVEDWEQMGCERLRNPWGWADHNAPILKGHGEPTPVRFWLRETWCEYGGGIIFRANWGRFTPISDGIGGPWSSPVVMPKAASRASFDLVGVWAKRDESGASPVGWSWLLTLQRVENE